MEYSKDFVNKILGIDDELIDVEDYFINKDKNAIVIRVSLKKRDYICQYCRSDNIILHSYREKIVKHSWFMNQPCDILYHYRRLKCKCCNKTFTEPNPFVFGYNKVSDATVESILLDLKTASSYKDIAKRHNVSSQTVLNYMDKYICPKRKKLPEVLCIDEFKNLSYGKGKYACLLVDYLTGEIVDVLPNRQIEYLQHYFQCIPPDEINNVKYLVSDMYEGYKHLSIYNLPKATLVIDGFHYIRYITQAFNKVRIRIQSQFNTKSKEYKLLKKYWKLLLKDSRSFNNLKYKWSYYDDYMTEKEFVYEISHITGELYSAYCLKQEYFDSYRGVPYEEADEFLRKYITKLVCSNIKEFVSVADTFTDWKPYIVNSFNRNEYGRRMSNGIIEGTNNKIKVLKKVSYGYSDFYHFRNRIMYVFNKLKPLSAPIDIKKIKVIKKTFYRPRKSYLKGFLKNKENRFSNPYGIIKDSKMLTNEEAIKYLKGLNITKDELSKLNNWIKSNHSFHENPSDLYDENGVILDFLSALRRNK